MQSPGQGESWAQQGNQHPGEMLSCDVNQVGDWQVFIITQVIIKKDHMHFKHFILH